MADSLRTLDASGNISLGNEGALQLLKAYDSKFCTEEDSQATSLNLRACGIESPLPPYFLQVVQCLCRGDGSQSSAPFKVDFSGNLIDQEDNMALLS